MSSCGTIRNSVVSHHYNCRVSGAAAAGALGLHENQVMEGGHSEETNRNHNYRWTTMKQRRVSGAGPEPNPRPWGTPTWVAHFFFFIAFTSWLEDEKMRGNVNQTYVSVWSIFFFLFLFFFTFIHDQQEWDSSRQQVTSAGKLKMMKSTSQAQCGWGANPTMLIGTTGLSPLLGEAGCSVKDSGALQINADVEMLNLIFCMKTYGWKLGREKMIMKKVNTISMTHLLSQAEYICPFTRLSWWLAPILW